MLARVTQRLQIKPLSKFRLFREFQASIMSSPKYAKDQAPGFSNRIERVAIVGAGGQVGSHIAKSILGTGKHTVTAITREDSKSTMPEGINIARVNYDNEESLVSALKGQQFFIISMAVTAPPGTQDKLIAAAAKAGVPWVMPNSYCPDFTIETFAKENLVGVHVANAAKAVENTGVSSWVGLVCSFWYEYSLAMGIHWYGFDFTNKKVTLIDNGKTKINTSTWEQCGRAVAQFLSLKELPDDENDTSPSISQWRNAPLYISSYLVSQRDMLDSAHRVLGTTDADWTIEHEESGARYKRGMEMFKNGERAGFGICMYTRTFFLSGEGDFQSKIANGVLGLPEEDFDASTKKAIEMVQSGWDPRKR